MFSRNLRKTLVSSFKNSRILYKSECCGIDVSSQFLEDYPNMDVVDKDFPVLRNMISKFWNNSQECSEFVGHKDKYSEQTSKLHNVTLNDHCFKEYVNAFSILHLLALKQRYH